MTINMISAGEFKAKCLKLMDEVHNSGHSLTITKRGKKIAKLVPSTEELQDPFGCLKHTVTILGDILAPINETWNAHQ